jgi:GntR family transcriptional regulator
VNTELLQRDLGAPRHHQVFSVLRSGIMSGRYTPGSYLPGEDTLTLEFGVSRATIRRAMQSLEGEKLIERRQGRGTRVVYDDGACHVARHMGWFGDPVQEMETMLLSFDTVPASPDVARELGMQPGGEAVRLVRLRSANREPLRVMTSYLPDPSVICSMRQTLPRRLC